MLEIDLKREKDFVLLNETQLDVSFNQRDLTRAEIVRLNHIIEKLFNESEAIKNLVNNGSVVILIIGAGLMGTILERNIHLGFMPNILMSHHTGPSIS